MKAKDITGLTGLPMTAADIMTLHESHLGYFDDLWTRGKENELYRTGKNLSDKQEGDYYKQDRIPFPNAITADKLNRVISSERNSRTSMTAEAKKPESEVKAELVKLRFKQVESDSDLQWTESEIFESGVAIIYGVGEVCTEYNRKNKKVTIIKDVDYQNVIWDSNARKYFKEDASFMAERKLVYRRDIRLDYGDAVADAIEITNSQWGRTINDYYGVSDIRGRRDNDIIPIFKHYQKVIRTLWYVIFNGDVVAKETSKQDAEEVLRMLKLPYLFEGVEIPKADVQRHDEECLDKYILTPSNILEYEETDLEDYTYIIYQAFHFKDKIWCLTDILKPKNKFMDKLISQIDYAFGADLKNGWEIIEPWLAEGQSIEEAIRSVKNGEPIISNRPGALRSIPSKGANPQWLQVYSVLKEDEAEYAGGALFSGGDVGKQREAKETVAMKLRQQQLIATLFIDNLRRWKIEAFKRVLGELKRNDTDEQTIKIHGGALSPMMLELLQKSGIYSPSQTKPGVGYITLNQPGNKLSYLDDADVDIAIKEESIADGQKEIEYEKMTMIEKNDPDLLLSPSWRKIKLEKIGAVSYEDLQKIETEIEQAKQMQAKQAEEARQAALGIEREKLNISKADVLVKDKGRIIGATNQKELVNAVQ
ncbi:MAG: hypothetical protein IPJ03_16890 [Ignavibacteriales bacterium]|nr:hypothetical protein [Ignavibacteriales bacterium]